MTNYEFDLTALLTMLYLAEVYQKLARDMTWRPFPEYSYAFSDGNVKRPYFAPFDSQRLHDNIRRMRR